MKYLNQLLIQLKLELKCRLSLVRRQTFHGSRIRCSIYNQTLASCHHNKVLSLEIKLSTSNLVESSITGQNVHTGPYLSSLHSDA